VTSTDRTISVSSRTPSATANPISANDTTGSVASTANVPASTSPAEVITPPVAPSPMRGAPLGPELLGLLVHPGHQKDVVVDPERHEEHEHDQRQRRVGAGEAEHVAEDQCAEPQGRPEREDDRRDQDQRRDHRPQQRHQDHNDNEKDQRDDHLVVVTGGVQGVPTRSAVATGNRLGSVDLVYGVAHPPDRVEGGLAVEMSLGTPQMT
jgi:hypothetical protein